MGTLQDLTVGLLIDTSNYTSGLSEATGQSESASSSIIGGLSGIGKAALGIGVGGIVGLVGGLAGAVGSASEAQGVMAQLEAVVASTGGAAGMSAEQMMELGSSLSAANGMSKFGDEAIGTAEGLLATFTNIGSETFPAATLAMVDMATAMGTDVSGSAMMLGKALNDPLAGMGALSKAGVGFTDEQKLMVEQMMKVGDVAGAQGVILDELGKQFGGSALASAQTFSGQIATLQDKFGEMMEGIGMKLLPLLSEFASFLNSPEIQAGIDNIANLIVDTLGSAIGFITDTVLPAFIEAWGFVNKEVIPRLQPLIDFVESNIKPILAGMVAALVTVVVPAFVLWATTAYTAASATVVALAPVLLPIAAIGLAVGLLYAAWESNFGDIQGKTKVVVDFVRGVIEDLVSTIRDWYTKNLPALTAAWETVKTNVSAAVKLVGDAIKGTLAVIVGFINDHKTEIVAIATAAWGLIKTNVETTINIVLGIVRTVMALLKGDWGTAWSEIKGVASTAIDGIKETLRLGFDLIKNVASLAWDALKLQTSIVWGAIKDNVVAPAIEGVKTILNNAWEAIKTTASTAWNTLKNTTIGTVLEGIKTLVSTATEGFKNVLALAWSAIDLAASTAWALIKDTTIGRALTGIKTLVDTFITNVKTALSTAWEAVKTTASTAWGAIKDTVIGTALTGIVNLAGTKLEEVKSKISAAWDQIKTTASTAWNNLKDVTIGGALEQIILLVKNKIGEVWKSIDNLRLTFVEKATTFATAAGEIGSGIINGIIEGVGRGVGALAEAVKAAARAALQAALNLLGIKSPSTVTRDEIGKPFSAGIAEGIIYNGPLIVRAVEGTLGDALKSVGSTFTSFGSFLSAKLMKPIDARAKAATEAVEGITERIADLQEARDAAITSDVDFFTAYNLEQAYLIERNKLEEQRTFLLGRQGEALAEQAEQAARVAAFDQAKSDLEYLEQQSKLLEMIAEHGLDVGSVLGDLQLGLSADPAKLLEAMTRATRAVAEQTEAALIDTYVDAGGAGAANPTGVTGSAIDNRGGTINNTWNITGEYKYQSEQTLVDEIRARAMLMGGSS